ncbi:uncharacterized protein LOC109839118 [Asparagus officinalis]|uniref:uncharacterized protein LOC109839118 n=1 Tax=Asparagus officinalis TaxID=4686 RepID=UPI00098E360D|nr:uncharacterized protein LOC109839118 [Asparagus officinalis]
MALRQDASLLHMTRAPQDTGRGDCSAPMRRHSLDPTRHAEMPPSLSACQMYLRRAAIRAYSVAVELRHYRRVLLQGQAETVRRNRNAPRSYEHHGGSRSFSQHYHQLALEGRGDLGHFADCILTSWSPKYADEEKKAPIRDLAEKLHAKVHDQLSQTQVDSNTPTRLSREEEDSIIETVIGLSRKNRYRWRGSEHRPYESSSTYESAAQPGCSSSQEPTMEQRMKAMEDWQSHRESELLQMAEEERRRREQRELEFAQFISTLPSDSQEAYRRRFMADQAGTSRQGGVSDEDDDDRD